MGLETGTYISDLTASNPTSGDPKSQGDDHIRLVKATILATFPNVTGAVTATHTELNYVDGVTSAIQTQMDLKAPIASPVFTGVVAVPLGAEALPSYTFTGDLNTGMWSPGADILAWSNGGAESLRIDSSGNGTFGGGTVSGFKWDVNGTTIAVGTKTASSGAGGHMRMRDDTGTVRWLAGILGTAAATGFSIYDIVNTAERLRIEVDGKIYTGLGTSSPYNYTTATDANMVVLSDGYLYRSTSSIKYKDNVRDYTDGISKLMSLRPVLYNSIGLGDEKRLIDKELKKLPLEEVDGKLVKPTKLPKDYVMPPKRDYAGFIAEEVDAAGLGEFVQYAEDGSPDALHYGHMASLLAKAIQEQQGIIVGLVARVAALEAKLAVL